METLNEEDVSRNWGDFNNIDFLTAQAGVTVNTFRLEPYKSSTKKLLGAKYTLARAAANPETERSVPGFRAVSAFIRNPNVFGRAWAVHEIVPIRDVAEGQRFIDEHVNELRWKALFLGEQAPALLAACPDAKRYSVRDRLCAFERFN